GTSQFVTVRDHGNALGDQERRDEVADLAEPKLLDLGIIGRSLGPTVPGTVVGFAVVTALAVGLVVFLVAGDQTPHREPVMCGHEVNGGHGAAARVLVKIGGTRQAGSQLRKNRGFTPPEVANRVTVLSVPFGP